MTTQIAWQTGPPGDICDPKGLRKSRTPPSSISQSPKQCLSIQSQVSNVLSIRISHSLFLRTASWALYSLYALL